MLSSKEELRHRLRSCPTLGSICSPLFLYFNFFLLFLIFFDMALTPAFILFLIFMLLVIPSPSKRILMFSWLSFCTSSKKSATLVHLMSRRPSAQLGALFRHPPSHSCLSQTPTPSSSVMSTISPVPFTLAVSPPALSLLSTTQSMPTTTLVHGEPLLSSLYSSPAFHQDRKVLCEMSQKPTDAFPSHQTSGPVQSSGSLILFSPSMLRSSSASRPPAVYGASLLMHFARFFAHLASLHWRNGLMTLFSFGFSFRTWTTTIDASKNGLIAFGSKAEGDKPIPESGSQEASTLMEPLKSMTMICRILFPNNRRLSDTNISLPIRSMTSTRLRNNSVFLGQNQKKS